VLLVLLGHAAALGVVVRVIADGCVMLTDLVDVQPFSSVAVTVDVPLGSVVTLGPVAPLLHV
jgi:hypothetical protein